MTNKSTGTFEMSDADLVSRSVAGDRESFNRIVLRYQNLICSLAYNALGNLGQSEDVAQETFIAAWKNLDRLREPHKLRAWLCGIVRNRIHKNLERDGREPSKNAETLEAADDSPANHALPSEEAISREEQAILWRSLEVIPTVYREPLILFYREHQSVEKVAEALGLSEDAVKQRLSRGRKLLQDEVQAFVEQTLRRSAPDQGFSGAVLAALPSAPAVTAGMAASSGKGAAVTKSGLLGAWLAPLLGLVGGMAAHWLIFRAAPTQRERRLKKIAFIGLWVFVLAWCVAGQLGLRALSRHREWSDRLYFTVMTAFWWFYAMAVATLSTVMFQRISTIRRESEGTTEIPQSGAKPLRPTSRIMVVAGVYLACFGWLIGLAREAHDQVWAVIIAVLMVSLAILNFFQLRGAKGVAAARAVAGHLALALATILVILNCRLETWEASLHRISIAEMHRLLPAWVIPGLTLTLVAWVVLLLQLPKIRRKKIPRQGGSLGLS